MRYATESFKSCCFQLLVSAKAWDSILGLHTIFEVSSVARYVTIRSPGTGRAAKGYDDARDGTDTRRPFVTAALQVGVMVTNEWKFGTR